MLSTPTDTMFRPAVPTAPFIITAALLTLAGGGTNGLQVYDCDGPNTTYQVILMLEPEGCPDPEKDYEEPRLEWYKSCNRRRRPM